MKKLVPLPGLLLWYMRPPLLSDQLPRDRKTHPGPLRFGREKRIVQPVGDLPGYAGPGIGELDLDACRIRRFPHEHAHGASRIARLDAVQGDIENNLLHLIAVQHAAVVAQEILESEPHSLLRRRVRNERESFLDESGKRYIFRPRRNRPGEVEQILDDIVKPRDLVENDLHVPAPLRVVAEFLVEHLRRRRDSREGISYLMRDTGGKLPEGSKPVRPPQLLLHLLLRAEIFEDHDRRVSMMIVDLHRSSR